MIQNNLSPALNIWRNARPESGVTVTVLDTATGLEQPLAGGLDFAHDKQPFDDPGHGTHMAGNPYLGRRD